MKKQYRYFVVVVFFLGALCLFWWNSVERGKSVFPIRHVIVEGDYWHVSPQEIESVTSSEVKSGYFFINLFSLRRELFENEPWLQSVTLSRQWPDTLIIHLTQRVPIAVLNKKSLVSDLGDVFSPPISSFPSDLPQFFCDKSEAKLVLQQYLVFESLSNTAGLSIVNLKLTPEGSWSLEFSNNIVVMLGDQDILERLTRFVKVYQQVFVPEHREPSYVDMRYGHGMAVQWKS